MGTTVKLAQALWIVPLSLATAARRKAKARIQWPWFIAFLCLATLCNTYVPANRAEYGILSQLAKIGLTVTLYLIGSGISIATLKQVGHLPLLLGVLLWLAVLSASLALIRAGLVLL